MFSPSNLFHLSDKKEAQASKCAENKIDRIE